VTTIGRYDGGALVYSTSVEQDYDDWGNPTETRHKEGTATWQRATRQFSVDFQLGWTTRLLKEENLSYDFALGEVVAGSTIYQYDQFALTDRGTVVGQAPGYGPSYTNRGNVTTVRRFLASEDRYIDTKSYYDTVGNAIEVKDPLNHSAYTGYSSSFHYAYPTSVTNALGHVAYIGYSINSGLPTARTDPNSQTTSYQYDAYNRPTLVTSPNGGWTSWTYNDTYFNGAYRTWVKTEKAITATDKTTAVEYRDGLGRPLRAESWEPGTSKVYVDRQYALCACTGKTTKVSMPYRSGDTVVWTESQYDGIGRIKKVIPPDGTASVNYLEYKYKAQSVSLPHCEGGGGYYSRRAELVGTFDAKGVGKVSVYDFLGALRQVREDAAADFSSSTVTNYVGWYDPTYLVKNGLNYARYGYASIYQGVQTRYQKLDSLGRTVAEQHPESGLTTFTYDDAGRALTKTDARGKVTTTTYDNVNRPLTIDFSDSTPDITCTYDSGSYGIGRVYSVSNSVATSVYTYSNMGWVTREDKTINSIPFYTTNTYNLAGEVTSTRLPNGTTITSSFDTVGRLSSVTSDWVDANHPATLASGFVYHASQVITQVDFGNGTRMTRAFNSGLQLKTLKQGTPALPGQFLDLEYDYDEGVSNTGQIMGITNYNDRTKDLAYTYDDFHRLATAQTAGSHWGLSFTYDRYGNRLTQSAIKGAPPTSGMTYDQVTNRTTGWTYDAAGNVTNDGRHVYTWDALNQQTTMDTSAAEYRYDASGTRVMTITPTATTYYVFGVGEYSGGVWTKLYFSMQGAKFLEYSNGTTYFFHTDDKGTPRVETNLAGQVVETWESYPYGEQWTMSGGVGNKRHFTGKERDSESGLDYFGARYYSGRDGRFTTPDGPFADQWPSEPQSWNLYTYTRNNPLRYVDAEGRKVIESRKEVTYKVTGKTAAEAWNNARETSGFLSKSGEKMSGLTKVTKFKVTNIKNTGDIQNVVGGYQAVVEITSADVVLDQQIALPEWSERSQASPEEQAAWDSGLEKLRDHEDKHASINREEADKLDSSLPGSQGAGTAGSPQKAVQKAGENAISPKLRRATTQRRKRNDEFDVQTNHGRQP
jgi:RHS repeat-associated protein